MMHYTYPEGQLLAWKQASWIEKTLDLREGVP